jgi:cell division GTPase FtsZ
MVIHDAAGEETNIIFGAVVDPRLEPEHILVTVIATGLGGIETPVRMEEHIRDINTIELKDMQRKNLDIPAYCRNQDAPQLTIAQNPSAMHNSDETSPIKDKTYVAPYMKMLMD